MKSQNKTFVLCWIYCGRVTQVKESTDVKLIQLEKSRLKKQPQYQKGKFEIRTKEGLKHKLILNP